MTRRVLYVAHALRPTAEETLAHKIALIHCLAREVSPDAAIAAATRRNIEDAMRWLTWLRRSFPETTFIAPWIASVLAGADDSDPAQREMGLADAFATIERCDGVVLCGPRISEGMRREMEHGTSCGGELSIGHGCRFNTYDLAGAIALVPEFRPDQPFAAWAEPYLR